MLSINLSPLQFRDPELCPQIFACIERHGLAPGNWSWRSPKGADGECRRDRESNLACLIEAGFQLPSTTSAPVTAPLAYLPRLQVATPPTGQSFTQGWPATRPPPPSSAPSSVWAMTRHPRITAEGWKRWSSRPGWYRRAAIGCRAICSVALCPGSLPATTSCQTDPPPATRPPQGGLLIVWLCISRHGP